MDPTRKSEPVRYEKRITVLREERRQEEARLGKLRAGLCGRYSKRARVHRPEGPPKKTRRSKIWRPRTEGSGWSTS